MKNTYENNSKYTKVFTSKVHNVSLYMPQDVANGYHMSRYVAAGAQNIYAAGGATKELLNVMMDKMLELCNDEKNVKSLRTDVATLANNIKYRLKYPVDEDCALRMGAIYTFADGEDAEQTDDFWTNKKLAWAKGDATQNIPPDPELYSFFLSIGIASTPAWKEQSNILTDTSYFKTRMENLNAMTPQH